MGLLQGCGTRLKVWRDCHIKRENIFPGPLASHWPSVGVPLYPPPPTLYTFAFPKSCPLKHFWHYCYTSIKFIFYPRPCLVHPAPTSSPFANKYHPFIIARLNARQSVRRTRLFHHLQSIDRAGIWYGYLNLPASFFFDGNSRLSDIFPIIHMGCRRLKSGYVLSEWWY